MMSKKSSGRVSSDELRTLKSGKAFPVVLFCILAVSIIAVVRTSSQRTAQGSETSTVAARNAGLAAATNEVLQETSQLRELAVLRPVQSSAQSRAEIERMIIGNL